MRENKPRGNARIVLVIVVVVAIAAGIGLGIWLALGLAGRGSAPDASVSTSAQQVDDASGGQVASVQAAASAPAGQPGQEPPPAPVPEVTPRDYAAMPAPEEMRAMWISFLEWRDRDISGEAAFRAAYTGMLDECVQLGLNTVIVAVRPFSDAFYPSAIYPWSHLLAGAQGADPGYDPLAIMLEEAHARGLRFEAWINPYRVQDTKNGPETLSANNPALLNPQRVRDVGGNRWFDPGLAEVREMVVAGVLEIVQNYDVDGIHFDDYFYPEFTPEQKEAGVDVAFDAAEYEAYEGTLSLADWRREHVNTMVRGVYAAVKAANPSVSFGISVQGNNDNNYNAMYCNVREWMAWEGYVDYVMPQMYWGFDYRTPSGREDFAFRQLAATWAFYPRVDGVRLYSGLGAYRIGAGDGGSNAQDEWQSGRNLANMVLALREEPGFSGFALFRHDFVFNAEEPLAAQEAAALAQVLQAGDEEAE